MGLVCCCSNYGDGSFVMDKIFGTFQAQIETKEGWSMVPLARGIYRAYIDDKLKGPAAYS